MYFLTKFCRVCITSNENLRDIDSCDYDSIKISEKLKAFTKTGTNIDNWSAFICTKCIRKLRVSYEFDKMCKKSSIILRQYLTELFACTDRNSRDKFVNSEVRIQIKKLPQQTQKRKYLKRETRCSLLKDLLTKIKDDRKHFEIRPSVRSRQHRLLKTYRNKKLEGGLRPLLQFTRSYNYGYKIERNKLENIKFDSSPLEKLTDFVNSFFKISLSRFHEKISSVLEEAEEWLEESDDLEEMIKPSHEEPIKFEEVIVEPDITIKKEIITDDINDENTEFELSFPCSSTSAQVKIEKVQIKVEPEENIVSGNQFVFESQCSSVKHVNTTGCKSNAEIYPTLCQTLGQESQSSLNLLQEFTEMKFQHHNNKAGYTVLQRTKRGKFPFINPQLKKQFLHQDFKCGVCNRRFKSQGYLQAHFSKMKHKP